MGHGKMEMSHFPTILLLFPVNFTHFFLISQNVLLAISHSPPFSHIPPHFPPFPTFLHFFLFPKPLWLGG